MSMNGVSASSSYNASQSSLQSLDQMKRRKHPSVSDVAMQNPSAPTPPITGGQSGSKVNIFA